MRCTRYLWRNRGLLWLEYKLLCAAEAIGLTLIEGKRMKEKILEICEELCCRKLMMDEQLILTHILDSFKIMELVCQLEDEFKIVLPPDEISDLNNFASVNHIAGLVEKINFDDKMAAEGEN